MPSYEFRCNDTGRLFEVWVKTYADYNPAQVRSPFTGGGNVSRIIRKVTVLKSSRQLQALMSGDEEAITALEEADPMTLGRSLRAMAEDSGEDMGTEFHEIVDRLAAGQAPHEIEAELPPPPSESLL